VFSTSPVLGAGLGNDALAGLLAVVAAAVELVVNRTVLIVVAALEAGALALVAIVAIVVALVELAGSVAPAVGRLATTGGVVATGWVAVWLLPEQAAKALARMTSALAPACRLSRTVGLAMSRPPSRW
jgi:hypothetical protein